MEGAAPAEAQRAMTNIERAGNPWGEPRESRGDWAQGLEIPTFADKPDAEYLYFVGCAASFDEANQKVATSIVRILQAADVDFAILGKEETCNGDPARRIGNEYLFQMQAEANITTFNKYEVKKVLTGCPHCFNTLKNEYPQFGFNAEVLHHTDLVVHVHDRGQHGVGAQRRGEGRRLDQPGAAGREVGDTEALLLEALAGVEHGFVLGACGQDVAPAIGVGARDPEDRQVVGFGGAGGKHDLIRRGPEECRDLRARRSDARCGARTQGVRR